VARSGAAQPSDHPSRAREEAVSGDPRSEIKGPFQGPLPGKGPHRRRVEKTMDTFMQAAIAEARQGLAEGGIPIGSVLVLDGAIVGRGHNRRVQQHSPILHAEMDAFENAGRLSARDYARCTLYSTLSPCDMCSGTTLLYKIPQVIIGENQTFRGPEEYLRSRGVTLNVLNDPTCIQLMRDFIAAHPELWHEDIGV
jgi:creatinine deaminase